MQKVKTMVFILLISLTLSITTFADWEIDEQNKKFISEDGSYVKGWHEIDGCKYYFDDNGNLITGSKIINGIRCRFDETGKYLGTYTGWTKIKGKNNCYYVDGVKQTGWCQIGEKMYYFGSNGRCTTGEYIYLNCRLNFSENGALQDCPHLNGSDLNNLTDEEIQTLFNSHHPRGQHCNKNHHGW